MKSTVLAQAITSVAIVATLLLAATAFGDWRAVATRPETPLLWWAARAFGFVSLFAMTLSMLFGLALSSRTSARWLSARTVSRLHQDWTIVAVITMGFHIVAVILNTHGGIGALEAVVPGLSDRLTGPLTLGIVSGWGLVVLAASSWLRRHLSYAAWRAVHGTAFGAFLLALAHGVLSGTDSGLPFVQWYYLATGALVGGGIIYRALATGARADRRARATLIRAGRQDGASGPAAAAPTSTPQTCTAGKALRYENQNAVRTGSGASRRPASGPAVATPARFHVLPVSRSW